MEDSEQVFPLSTPKMYPQWIANASLRETVMKDRHTTMCARVIVLEDFLIELDARIHLYEVRFEEKDLK